jgi:hypothetical protein
MGLYEVGRDGMPGYVWADSEGEAMIKMISCLMTESGYTAEEIKDCELTMIPKLIFRADEKRCFAIMPSDVPFTSKSKKHGIG